MSNLGTVKITIPDTLAQRKFIKLRIKLAVRLIIWGTILLDGREKKL